MSDLGPPGQHEETNVAITVLVADDNARYRTGIVRAIARRSEIATALEVADGASALEVIRQERPDVVLIDARMPIVDGLTVVRTVLDDPDLPDVPLIVMSADVDFKGPALDAGATGFIDKCAGRSEICAALVAAAGRPPKTTKAP